MRQRSILLVFMLLMSTVPVLEFVSADGQPIMVDTFSNGSQSNVIALAGGVVDSSSAIELDQNITVQDARFDVEYVHTDDSPGQIWLDIDEDGYKEWAFEGLGAGDIGNQNTFSNGSTWASAQYDDLNQLAPEFKIPSDADLKYSYFNATFESDLGDGFYSLGRISDIASGDVDADANQEAILLSHDFATTGFDAAISYVDWNPVTGITFSPWFETCDEATELSVADVNSDNKADIATISLDENKVCLHLYDKVTGDYTPPDNTTVSGSTVKAGLSDIDGDGSADILSIRSGGELEWRLWTGSGFGNPSSVEIYEEGSMLNLAVLTDLQMGKVYGPSYGEFCLVQDEDNNWNIYNYSNSQSTMNEISSFSGIEQNIIISDLDGDGDLDAVGASSSGFVMKENRGILGWDSSVVNGQMNMENASIFDYDGDGLVELLTINEKTSDNDPATIDGNFSLQTFSNASTISSPLAIKLKPGSLPGQAIAIDLDNDGNKEHLVPVGESNQGLFIGAWHRIGIDIQGDGVDDINASGYARSATDGLPMLTLVDSDHSTALILDSFMKTITGFPDSYGNGFTPLNLNLNSTINGTFNFTSLNIGYDINFNIHMNPNPSGNLTNVINQGTARQPGQFSTNLSFNSTKAGSITISDLVISYHLGAAEIFIPPVPVLTSGTITSFSVELTWNDITEYTDNLVRFEIYRAIEGDPLDSDQATFVSNINTFTDEDLIVDSEYRYAVRSIHEGGIRSNLSNVISLTIPYPTPPAPISSISASDVPGDEGGALAITWDHSAEVLLDSYQIYVETNDFSQVSNLTPIKTIAHSINSTTITGLIDGTSYWVSVAAVDSYGNYSEPVITSGPHMTRNDTAQTVLLSVDTGPVMSLGAPFWVDVSSMANGEISNFGNVTIILTQDEFTWILAENVNPNIKLTYTDLSEMGQWVEILYGDVTITVTHTGFVGNAETQPLSPASLIINKKVLVQAVLTTPQNPFILNIFDQGEVQIDLEAVNLQHIGLMENLSYDWTVLDSGGMLKSSGTGTFTSGMADITVEVAGGGILNIILTTPDWLTSTPTELAITLSSSIQEEVEDGPWSPSSIEAPTFNCPDLELDLESSDSEDSENIDASQSYSLPMICTVSNVNNYSISIEFNLDGWTTYNGISFTPDVNTLELAENQSSDLALTVSVTNISALGTGQYYATITGFASTNDYPDTNDLIISNKILWAVGEEVQKEEVANVNYTEPPISSQSLTVLYVGGAGTAIVAGLIWILMIALRRKRENADTWTEDDFDNDDDPISYSEDKRVSKPLPVGLSLDEIKYEGAEEIEYYVPQNRDNSLFAEVEGREVIDEPESENRASNHSEDEYYVEEDNSGVTIDEDGTEWYEDDVGVWWYRDPGMDDWAEFHEE